MKILAMIPARGGSKGIPGKNIKELAGKPLIGYTCEAALASKKLDRVICSTDSEEIAEVAKSFGVEVPFMRLAEHAQDKSPAIDGIIHALEKLETDEGYVPDALIYLQPTSPLRTAEQIDEAIDLFEKENPDSLVSVQKVPHCFNPVSVMKIEDGKLKAFMEGHGDKILRRQDKPEVYARNGPALLISKRDHLLGTKTLYGENHIPYIMEVEDSFDIDDIFDWGIVEFLMKQKLSK